LGRTAPGRALVHLRRLPQFVPRPSSQDDPSIHLDLFRHFSELALPLHTQLNADLKTMAAHFHRFPRHGCSLVLLPSEGASKSAKSLWLLAPDEYTFAPVSRYGSNNVQFTSTPPAVGCTTLCCAGSVPDERVDDLLATVRDRVVHPSKYKVKGKSAHTPDMVYSCVQNALAHGKEPTSSFEPRGGFADVGQHTQFEPRETTWPLACSALQLVFEVDLSPRRTSLSSPSPGRPPGFFASTLALFHAALAAAALASAPAPLTNVHKDVMMQMPAHCARACDGALTVPAVTLCSGRSFVCGLSWTAVAQPRRSQRPRCGCSRLSLRPTSQSSGFPLAEKSKAKAA
jgi:hypothetical protein